MKKARFWIGILISLLALIFVFRNVDLGRVRDSLASANYWLLVASVPFLLLFLVLRAFRWRLLFYPQQGLRIRNLLAVINIGYLVSNILPFRLGDVARAYVLGDTEPVSRATAFSTIVVERVLDALCAVTGFLLVLPFAPAEDWMLQGGIIVGIAVLVAVVLMVIFVRLRLRTLRLLGSLLSALHWPSREAMANFYDRLAERTHLRFLARLPWADRPRLEGMAGSLIDGLSGVTTLRLGPRLLAWSVLIWVDITVFYWLILRAFEPSAPFVAGLAVNSVSALGMTVPSSPGNLGVFHLTASAAANLFVGDYDVSLGYAIVAHAIVYIVYTVIGLISMAQQNLTYSELQRRISAQAQEAP